MTEYPLHKPGIIECRIPTAMIATGEFDVFHIGTGSLQSPVCRTRTFRSNHIVGIAVEDAELHLFGGFQAGRIHRSANGNCGRKYLRSTLGFAQEQNWNFNADETADYAAFFKQPSAIEGKCNAEVMGIDIHRDGFSWNDMNTWKNAEGKIWHTYSATYAETLFGVCVNAAAPFNGKTSSLSWTNTEGDNKWYPV